MEKARNAWNWMIMNNRKVRIASIAFLALAGTYVFMNIDEANGQFAASYGGTTYTVEDIQQGKAEHLHKLVTFEITSESMLPTYQVGEFATMNKSFDFMDLEVSDVIVFDCDGQDVSHRIIGIKDFEDGSRAVETFGDNNTAQLDCETKIPDNRYIAKVVA